MGEFYFFIKGMIIGLSIAVPVGPIGILCIRRTLTQGRLIGFLSGLGAATADAFYGAIAGFGLTVLSDLMMGHQTGLRLIGGGLLCIIGVKTFLSKPTEQGRLRRGEFLLGCLRVTLILTAHQSHDDPLFRCGFCRTGSGKWKRSFSFSRHFGPRRFRWFRFMVAGPERVYRLVAWDVQFQKDAVVKQNFRPDYHRIWPGCISKRVEMKG